MAVICAQLWSCKSIVSIVLLFSYNILCTLDTCVYTKAHIVLSEYYVKGTSARKYWGNQKEVSEGLTYSKKHCTSTVVCPLQGHEHLFL
jgi:hypothetical protein